MVRSVAMVASIAVLVGCSEPEAPEETPETFEPTGRTDIPREHWSEPRPGDEVAEPALPAKSQATPPIPSDSPLVTCRQSGDYDACIVERLERPQTAWEYEALVEAHRQTNDVESALAHMEAYRERWPDTPVARSYTLILRSYGR